MEPRLTGRRTAPSRPVADRHLRDAGRREPPAPRTRAPLGGDAGAPAARDRGRCRGGLRDRRRPAGGTQRSAACALGLGPGGDAGRLPDRRAGAVPGGKFVDGADTTRVRADAVRSAHPVGALDRRGLLGSRSGAGRVSATARVHSTAGARGRQLLRARASARAGCVSRSDLLLEQLAAAAVRVRSPDRVRRRGWSRAYLVRGAHPSVRSAADGVAVRHRRVSLVHRPAGSRVGGRAAGSRAARAPAGRPVGDARARAPAAARVLARAQHRLP